MSGGSISLGIVDDHQVLLDGLGAWIRAQADDIEVAVACPSWAGLLANPRYPVDVVLLDLELGDALPPAVKIATLLLAGVTTVVVSTYAEPALVRECISAGALGFVELVEEVQSQFGVTVQDVEITEENFGSIDAIDSFVERKRRAA